MRNSILSFLHYPNHALGKWPTVHSAASGHGRLLWHGGPVAGRPLLQHALEAVDVSKHLLACAVSCDPLPLGGGPGGIAIFSVLG